MERQFFCSAGGPIAETKQGKIRGFQVDGTYTFHGIKYADAKRFQMPAEPEPFEGVKDALAYGYVCPILSQGMPSEEIIAPHRHWPMEENCQYLNIWTQSLDRQAKKPVMVWLHGGGYAVGSSIEQAAYEGDRLSEYGDVVVVTLNHRLNILGYLDLYAFGEKYANSCNAGNADLVAALKWIHENIEAFGGDSENVTLFGQSGGGMKVWSLMNTPEADGLFQKGIIQSGLLDGFENNGKTDGTAIVKALLNGLGLKENEAEALETVPYARLAEVYNRVAPAVAAQGEYVGGQPVPNGWYVGDPRKVGFTEHAKTIPVIIGTVFGEFYPNPEIKDRYSLPEPSAMRLLEEKYGAHACRLAELFQKAYPGRHLTDLLPLDTAFRNPTKDFIEKKSAYRQAPTYSYLFACDFQYDGGKPAWHCAEIPFVFHNTHRIPISSIQGVSDRLEESVCGAWVHFARYGTPAAAGLPEWPACTPGREATMIFDRECEVRVNHDKELMELLQKCMKK